MMSRQLVTAKKVAETLGMNLYSVYEADRRGEIKNYGLGRSKRYDLNEILKLKEEPSDN